VNREICVVNRDIRLIKFVMSFRVEPVCTACTACTVPARRGYFRHPCPRQGHGKDVMIPILLYPTVPPHPIRAFCRLWHVLSEMLCSALLRSIYVIRIEGRAPLSPAPSRPTTRGVDGRAAADYSKTRAESQSEPRRHADLFLTRPSPQGWTTMRERQSVKATCQGSRSSRSHARLDLTRNPDGHVLPCTVNSPKPY
jgi:hypothetical protein